MDILLGKSCPLADLIAVVSDFFPAYSVALSTRLEDIVREPAPDVFGTVLETDVPGFSMGLSIDRSPVPEERFQSAAIALAWNLSEHFGCPVLCDGTGYGPDDSPYWSIVWDDGKPYLASDMGIDADPPRAPQIVRELEISELSRTAP